MKKLKHALLVVFSMALMLCLAFGAAACVDTTDPNGSETVTYTVTVTCEDQTGTANAKVQIKKDGANVGEAKALTDGKASFDLETGTYTATLTGVAEGYIFEDVTLTAENPSATIAVTKEEVPGPALSTYTVTVLCDDPEAILNAKVQIQKDGANVGEAKALTGGKASFELEAGDYTATLVDVAEGYTFDPVTMSATKTTAIINVTPETPLGPTLVTYTVNVSCEDESALVNARVVLKKDGVEADSRGIVNGKATFSLEAGDYTVEITGLASGYEYTAQTLSESVTEVTIKVTKRAVEDNKGTGTAGDPFIIETLVGEYDATVKYVDGEFQSVYFQYAAKEDGEYTVSSEDESNYSISFTGAKAVQGQVIPTAHAGEPADIAVTKGTVLTICVQEFDDTVTQEFTVHFVIKPYEAPAPAEGSSRETAKVIENWTGNHSYSAAPTYYVKYTSAKAQAYTVTATSSYGLYMSVYDAADPTSKAIAHVEIMVQDGTGNVTLEADKTYVFGISAGADGEFAAVTVTFTVEETAVSAEPDGSEANPYPLGELVGAHNLDLGSTTAVVYYTFTVEEDGKYIFTADTTLYLRFTKGLTTSWQVATFNAAKKPTKEVTLAKDTEYVFNIMAFGQTPTQKVSFSVVKKDIPPVDTEKGTQEKPETVTVLEGTYERVVPQAGYFIVYTAAAEEEYTFTVESFGSVSSIYIKLSNVTSPLSLSATKATTTFTAPAEALTIKVYLQGDPSRVTFTIAKVAAPEPEPEPDSPWEKGTGTQTDPYIMDELVGEFTVKVPADEEEEGLTVVAKHTAKAAGTYTVTLTNAQQAGGTVQIIVGEDRPIVLSAMDLATTEITLAAGDVVQFAFTDFTGGGTTFVLTVTAKATEPTPTPDPDSPWAGGKGTAADPYIMKEFAGTYKMTLGSMEMPGGLRYTVTAETAGKYTLTVNTKGLSNYFIQILIGDEPVANLGDLYSEDEEVRTVTIEVKAGDVIDLVFVGMQGAAEVEFTVAKAAN